MKPEQALASNPEQKKFELSRVHFGPFSVYELQGSATAKEIKERLLETGNKKFNPHQLKSREEALDFLDNRTVDKPEIFPVYIMHTGGFEHIRYEGGLSVVGDGISCPLDDANFEFASGARVMIGDDQRYDF